MLDTMLLMKQPVIDVLVSALKKLGYSSDGLTVESPRDLSHGDFSTSIALALAKEAGKSPREVAEEIVNNLDATKFKSVSIAGPGFINFTMSEYAWVSYAKEFDISNLSVRTKLDDKQILLEHTSLNLFKPFSIGHLFNNSLSVSLRNIMSFAGAVVTEVSFPSDISPGVAKGVWAILKHDWKDDLNILKIGEAYRLGVVAYKEDESAKEEIDIINKELYEGIEGAALEVYKKTREISMEYFDSVLERLGTHHNAHLFESLTAPIGTELVREHTPEIFTESDGAIIFEGSKHGLFDNVFVNSAGFATYLAKDLGLIKLKLMSYPEIDQYITVADIEQKQHFQLVKKTAELVFQKDSEKITYLQHGRLALPTGRISSRDGGVPIAEDLIEALIKGTTEKAREAGKELVPESAEKIALGALRYALLRASAGKNVVFDMESSLSFEGDSGPYLQYTYVRARSILKSIEDLPEVLSQEMRFSEDTHTLLQLIEQFDGKVERALEDYSPHHITQHILEIAQAFNSFYAHTKIANTSSEFYATHVRVTQIVSEALQTGLWLMGIGSVEEM